MTVVFIDRDSVVHATFTQKGLVFDRIKRQRHLLCTGENLYHLKMSKDHALTCIACVAYCIELKRTI